MVKQAVSVPYAVQKAFRFYGVPFVPNDKFDAVKAKCSAARLRSLIQQRLVRVGSIEQRDLASPAPQNKPIQEEAKVAKTPESTDSVQGIEPEGEQNSVKKPKRRS